MIIVMLQSSIRCWTSPASRGHKSQGDQTMTTSSSSHITAWETPDVANEWLTWQRCLNEFVTLLFR